MDDFILTKELVDLIAPTHQRSSCSDEDPNNYKLNFNNHWRCVRCDMLYRLELEEPITTELFDKYAIERGVSHFMLLNYVVKGLYE